MGGINTRLSLMTAVFAATVGAGAVAFWNLSGKIDAALTSISEIRISAATQTEQLKTANEKLSDIAVALGKINPVPSLQQPPIRYDVISLMKGDIGNLQTAVKTVRPDQSVRFFISSDNLETLNQLKDALDAKSVSLKTLALPPDGIYKVQSGALSSVDLNGSDKIDISSDNVAVMKEIISKFDTLKNG